MIAHSERRSRLSGIGGHSTYRSCGFWDVQGVLPRDEYSNIGHYFGRTIHKWESLAIMHKESPSCMGQPSRVCSTDDNPDNGPNAASPILQLPI